MSYKFQRLREKLRSAIASGELAGKLPGERALAKRFHVNAKTLSKALTDLAAEGVLDRSIGRGTFVKGSAPAVTGGGRWLLLCDENDADARVLLESLQKFNPDTQASFNSTDMRPSFLNAFSAVIDAASATSETLLRDLVVRNLTVVAVGREARTFSMHAILVDVALGATRVGRELVLSGHRRIAAVESKGSTALTESLRQTVSRLAPDAVIDTFSPEDAHRLSQAGVTAVVCDSADIARRVGQVLADMTTHQNASENDAHVSRVAPQIALAAIGVRWGEAPCSGCFVDGSKLVEQVVAVLRDPPAGRPATLWMAGEIIDRGTTLTDVIEAPESRSRVQAGPVAVMA